MQERLQKILAHAGIASRRKAEELLLNGRIKINGRTINKLGTKADFHRDRIEIDGQLIPPPENKIYILLNKPKGYVTTLNDPQGRPIVTDLIKNIPERLYPVGRLDYDTEGLLLLTNDGDFANVFQHPRHNIARTYLVKVKGMLPDSTLQRIKKGIYLEDGKTSGGIIKVIRSLEKNTWIEMTIWEGKNRQIKRMFEAIGHPTLRIMRISLGPFKLERNLATGSYRHLTSKELSLVKKYPAKGRAE